MHTRHVCASFSQIGIGQGQTVSYSAMPNPAAAAAAGHSAIGLINFLARSWQPAPGRQLLAGQSFSVPAMARAALTMPRGGEVWVQFRIGALGALSQPRLCDAHSGYIFSMHGIAAGAHMHRVVEIQRAPPPHGVQRCCLYITLF